MKKNYMLFFSAFLFLKSTFVFAQEINIIIPELNDKYSDYVKRLESGDTTVNYTEFRNSFAESKQYTRKGPEYDSLKKEMFSAANRKDFSAVLRITKAMLSIDYTSMTAHKYLQQTYKILGDTINKNKYKAIEFGLLGSILRSGDGKTCGTGWHIIQTEEAYFIFQMTGATLNKQSITTSGKKICDKMSVKTKNEGDKVYFFEATKLFEAEKKLSGN